MIGLAVLSACAPAVLEISAQTDASGLEVKSTVPLDRVEVRDARGALIVARSPQPPGHTTILRSPLSPGQYEIRGRAADQTVLHTLSVADRGPVQVHLEAPLGQDRQGHDATLWIPEHGVSRVGVVVTAAEAGEVAVHFGDAVQTWSLLAGERRVLVVDVTDRPVRGHVETEAGRIPLSIRPERFDGGEDWITLDRIDLPSRPDGHPDPTADAGRIPLPAPWWDAWLDALGLGFRARDDLAPRTHVGVALTNHTPRPGNLLLAMEVVDANGPMRAFRPRLREATNLNTTRRLIRVPPGESVHTSLPLYLDRSELTPDLQGTVRVTARWLGSEQVLAAAETPVVVRRGSGWATAVLGLGALGMVFGWLGIALGFRRWIRWPTHQLTTVAVFGSLSFTVGAASQVLGMGIASVLGPFAPFVLGLADDTVRMCLLGALVAVVPRPGAFAMATLLGWLMRAVALGAVHPVDLLYLGNAIACTEALLWIAGITRGSTSLRFPRLVLGLAVPHAIGTAVALAVSVVLYRLYYADWYVLALVAGPGFVYAAIGCAVAVPFSTSIQRVG